MARSVYHRIDLPDGTEVPDVPADLRKFVDSMWPAMWVSPFIFDAGPNSLAVPGAVTDDVRAFTVPFGQCWVDLEVRMQVRAEGGSGPLIPTGSMYVPTGAAANESVSIALTNGYSGFFTLRTMYLWSSTTGGTLNTTARITNGSPGGGPNARLTWVHYVIRYTPAGLPA